MPKNVLIVTIAIEKDEFDPRDYFSLLEEEILSPNLRKISMAADLCGRCVQAMYHPENTGGSISRIDVSIMKI